MKIITITEEGPKGKSSKSEEEVQSGSIVFTMLTQVEFLLAPQSLNKFLTLHHRDIIAQCRYNSKECVLFQHNNPWLCNHPQSSKYLCSKCP
jgi:hypothetical protein